VTAAPEAPFRPRLRTVLLTVNLVVLLLPLLGIAALRLYEDELIRSTESQLLAQGALVREVFRREYQAPQREGAPAPIAAAGTTATADVLLPRINVSEDVIRPPAPAALLPSQPADPRALLAGRALEPMLRAASRDTLVGVRVVDRSGIVVASSGTEAGLSLESREEVARALRGDRAAILRQRVSDEPEPPFASLSRGQRYRVFVTLPVTIDNEGVVGAVVLSRTPIDIAKALYLHRRALLLGAGVLLAAVVGMSTLTALTIVRPARELMRRAERVARGERGLAVRLSEPGTREMAQLAQAISSMATTLEDRADYIRTFAASVSHEFKTPLTAIRGATEILRDHGATMSPAEHERFLSVLDDSAARLDRLVRRLLELARADVAHPGSERTPLPKALAAAAARARASGLAVTVEPAPGNARVRMSAEHLEEVLANLLDNARVHGGPGVLVRMSARVDAAAAPPAAEIVVADDGAGITAANAAKVFTPFFTTARERGGSGLGLSIVRSLLEAHGGSIRLAPSPAGTTWILTLPAEEGEAASAPSPGK